MSVVPTPSSSPVTEDTREYAHWGRLPALSVAAAGGILLVTLSYSASRSGLAWSMPLFWAGVLLLYLPAVARLWKEGTSRHETVALLLILGLGLYLVRVLSAPLYFASFDELLHWRTADDILQTQQLFTENAGLPVSPLYPGLEIATNAVVSLSGLNIHEAGTIIVGAARTILVLALFLVFEKLSGSVRAAGLGTVIYMGSSTFLFFDAQYAYESLALPLVVFILFLILSRNTAANGERFIWSGLTALAIFAIVTVHHLSSFILLAFMVLWSVTTTFVNRGNPRQPNVIRLTGLLLSWSLVWLVAIASTTVAYLMPHALNALTAVQMLLVGQGRKRDLAIAGGGAFNFERILAMSSVGLIVLGLSLGFWHWRRRKQYQPLSVSLAFCALAYPSIPVLRLFDATWQISNRLAGFLFVSVAFVVSFALTELIRPPLLTRLRQLLALPFLAIIFGGGIAAGSNPVMRFPGPYVVIADERSVDRQGLSAEEWARQILGLNNRMAGDRIQASLMGSYGGQRMVFRHTDGINVSGIFLTPDLEGNERSAIKRAQIRYITIDRRISSGTPLLGYYFESWEQLVVPFVPPVSSNVVDKFDYVYDASRVFDSGAIVIYDVGAIAHGH